MLDDLAIFSDHQAITASVASTGGDDGNGIVFMDFQGQGEPTKLLVRVTEAFNNLTNLKVGVQQTTEADTTFASAETVTESTLLLADIDAAGDEFPIRFLPNIDKPRVRLYYTLTGTAPTTGKVFASVVEGEDYSFKDGLYVSPRNPTGAAATA